MSDKFVKVAEDWFVGKDFTTDWFSRKVRHWQRHLKRFVDKPVDVLELGSYEGRSAVFLMKYLPLARLTCVDLFNGEFESRFDANLAEFSERMTKVKGRAISTLDEMGDNKSRFSVIYLDAGKKRDPVFAMSLLAWPLLRNGGVMIWDDYEWGADKPSEDRPHDAIEAFLRHHEGAYTVLWKGSQVFIRKGMPKAGKSLETS